MSAIEKDNSEDDYFLRCYFQAHEGDVRCISPLVVPHCGMVSGSRDLTIRVWKPQESSTEYVETACLFGPTHFISSLCVLAPSTEYPSGILLAGSNDCAIYGFSLETNQAVFKLLGHSGTVASLSTGNFGTIISGSWDKTARIWIGQKTVLLLIGHQEAVWAVAMFPEQGIVITGSADKTIRLWRGGKTEKVFHGHEDCIRGLAVVSRTEFLSCSNDSTVRLWHISGNCLSVFNGHAAYIYDIAALNEKGDFITCGEDSTIKVWKNGVCTMTKEVPSSCLWSVCPLGNGDFAVGGSNGYIYVFTPYEHLKASKAVMAQYNADIIQLKETTKKIPDQEGSSQNDLLSLEALASPGREHGQRIMCRDGNSLISFEWDASQRVWKKVGDLLNVRFPDEGLQFEGEEYDHVFTIDVEGGLLLKLPYNNRDNPWVVAQKFINKHNLNPVYMDQIVNHIISNTSMEPQHFNLSLYSDPFTGEDRYVPGSISNASVTVPHHVNQVTGDPVITSSDNVPSRPKQFPQTGYVYFQSGNPEGLARKLTDFSARVDSEASLSSSEIDNLLLLTDCPVEVTAQQMDSLQKILYWPDEYVFPALDLFRLAVKSEVVNIKISEAGESTIFKYLLKHLHSGYHANVMFTLRIFCNFFGHPFGDSLLLNNMDTICAESSACVPTDHKQIEIALATLYLNYAVALHKSRQNNIIVTEHAVAIFKLIKDQEAVFRLMVCIGTLIEDSSASKIVRAADIVESVKTYVARCELPPKTQECAKELLNHLA